MAKRDWGHAEDYVEAMWMMLQQDEPDDYVIATGKSYSVEDYAKEAFKCINIEEYLDFIEVDRSLARPSEVPYLRGCYDKALRKMGWKPKTDFKSLVERMVDHDIQSRFQYGKSEAEIS